MNLNNEEEDMTFNVIIIGDTSVGKTSLVMQYTEGKFEDNYLLTIGIDNKVKKLVIYEKRIALNIWDTAGQERFKSIAKSYFNKSDGVLLVFDLTNIDSFNSIEKWMQELNSFKKEANGSIVLVGNKCDIKNNTIKNEEIDELINKYNLKYFKASAKENKNIKQSFEYLAKDIYSKKVLHNNMKHERHKSKNKEMHDMVQNFVKYTF